MAEMKKATLIALLTIVTMGIVGQPALFVKTAEAFIGPGASSRPAPLANLPADLTVPPSLTANITDPMLLEAWVRLYNHQEPMQLWDGSTITGRQLAQYALDQALPIVWDTGRVCSGG